MKINELINRLKKLQKQVGDVQILVDCDMWDAPTKIDDTELDISDSRAFIVIHREND
jgi:hypothetical protein